jgi:hypothetical protein
MHENCPFDGCKFNANSEAIATHIQKNHVKKEFFAKIQKLTTPEEIEKWRNERRKRYPTTENVILRQKAQEIRKERGEKLVNNKGRFGDKKNLPSHNKPQKNRKNFQKRQPDKRVQEPIKPLEPESSDSETEPPKKIPRFQGTQKLKDYHTFEETVKNKNALSLLGFYGSESEAEEQEDQPKEESIEEDVLETAGQLEVGEKPDEVPIQRETENFEVLEQNEKNLGNSGNPEENLEVSSKAEENPDNPIKEPAENSGNPRNKRNRRRGKQNETEIRPELPKTRKSLVKYSNLRKARNEFLEKLLQDDIRHERNVLLQCVRFVVRNGFFDDKETRPAKSEDPENPASITEPLENPSKLLETEMLQEDPKEP